MVHLRIQGNLEGSATSVLDRTVTNCIAGGQLLVVHLEDLNYASPEGLGALLEARQKLLAMGLSLTLSGVPARTKFLLSAWCLEPLFDEFKLERERFALTNKSKKAANFASLVGKESSLPVKIQS